MRNKTGEQSCLHSYLEEYTEVIVDRLKEIDIFIKSSEGALDLNVISDLLDISLQEIHSIMRKQNITSVTPKNFGDLMAAGSSRLCQTYRRELEVATPGIYTRENISYIYGIDLRQVNEACNLLELKEITWYTLPILLGKIPASKIL